jgi:hypothetical protein
VSPSIDAPFSPLPISIRPIQRSLSSHLVNCAFWFCSSVAFGSLHSLLRIFIFISPIRPANILHRCTLVHVLMDLFFSKGNKKSVYVCTKSCIVCSVNEVPMRFHLVRDTSCTLLLSMEPKIGVK